MVEMKEKAERGSPDCRLPQPLLPGSYRSIPIVCPCMSWVFPRVFPAEPLGFCAEHLGGVHLKLMPEPPHLTKRRESIDTNGFGDRRHDRY